MNTQKSILEFDSPVDHKEMTVFLNTLSQRYSFLGITSLGESILGKSIPLVTLGEGKKAVLYVGAHHGMEWLTSALLLRFINELCEAYSRGGKLFGYSMNYLFATRTLYIVPMLNPDGVGYQINGVAEDNPIRERLIAMNGGSEDFSMWQANARGVDLNRNYNSRFSEYKKVEASLGILGGARAKYSGEMPESEEEVGALCNFLRFNQNIRAVLTFHSQGEEIYCTSNGRAAPRSRTVGAQLAKMSGYRLCEPEAESSYCGLTDWCIDELNIPSFTVECGRGSNPLPLDDLFLIYARLREMLFMTPSLI